MGKTILLTGNPGTGKTTAIRQIVARLGGEAGGFYTEETRAGGVRQGFRLVTLDGREGILAHVNLQGRPRIGKYGVDRATLEAVGVGSIRAAVARGALVVIDEIGPMELLSEAFQAAVLAALDSRSPVLGTIVKRPHPFADRIKARPDVTVLELTRQNRDDLIDRVVEMIVAAR